MLKHRVSMLIALVAVLVGLLVFAWCRHSRLYRVTVLPQVGTQVVVPCAINDNGQIVGVCQGRFYLWERSKDWRELGRASEVFRINNAGQIAGTVTDPNGGTRAFVWDPNDGLTVLGTGWSAGRTLNNRGQVVGVCWNNVGGGGQVFLWEKAHGMRVITGLDGSPQAMNDAGQVVACRGSQRTAWVGVLWEPAEDGSMTETLLPSGAFCDINNNGYVLGQAFNFDERRHYAFIWRQDRGTEWLFPLENQTARVAALNDANQVAICEEVHSGWLQRLMGRDFRVYRESFVWTREKGRVFLDGCVLKTRSEYLEIRGMNNRGCIIGTVNWKTGDARRAVLLDPISQRWAR